MSNTLNKIKNLMSENLAYLWIDDCSRTIDCAVLEDAVKGNPDEEEVIDIPYNGWNDKLTELTEVFGDLTPSAFESAKRLFAYSFNEINWDYDKLTVLEKKTVSKEEFDELKAIFKC